MKKLLIGLLLFGMTGVSTAAAVKLSYSQATPPNSILAQSDNYSVVQDFSVPEGTGAISDTRKGLAVQADKKTDIRFSSQFVGEFSVDFRLFSQESGVNDASFVTFRFEDEATNEFFNVYYEMDNAEDVSVGKGNLSAAFPYGEVTFYGENGALVKGSRKIGGSFCNVAEEGKNAIGQQLRFEPSTMKVFWSEGEDWKELVDLNEAAACNNAGVEPMQSFGKYSVTISLSGMGRNVKKGRPAHMVLYGLNGQQLCGSEFTDNAGPSVHLPLAAVGVEGYDYRIPAARMFDVVDGETDFNGTMQVFYGGKEVPVSDGVIEKLKFGTYEILLKGGKDESGHVGNEKKFDLKVQLLHSGHTLSLDEEIYDTQIGVGGTMTFPAARAISEIMLGADKSVAVSASVKRQDSILETFDASNAFAYTFDKIGTYQVEYTSVDPIGHTVSRSVAVEVKADAAVFTFGEIPATVKTGSAYAFPQVSAKIGGQTVPVSLKLVGPDGREVKAGSVLQKVGYYTLTATAKNQSAVYGQSRGFTVRTGTEQMFENKRASVIRSGAKSPDYAYPYEGIEVTATRSNAKITYKTPIDLTKLSKSGTTLIEFLPTPMQQGIAEFGQINIELADVNDPSKTIDVKIHRSYDGGYLHTSLVRAAINKTAYAGMHWGTLVTTEGRGTDMSVSFSGDIAKDNLKCSTGKIWFDWEEKAFYCALQDMQLQILDLDNYAHVGIGNEWTGFSGNMATLSVIANTIENPNPKYMITSVIGQPLGGDFQTSKDPVGFDVDYAGNGSAPQGAVGKPYPVFGVTAFDNIDSDLPVTTEVYYAYKNPSLQKRYDLEDGRFIPDRAGKYTIVYASGDSSHRVEVTVKDSLPALGFEFAEGEIPAQMRVGESLVLPKVSAFGGSGVKNVAFSAKLNGKDAEISENRIVAAEEGTLLLKVRVTDYIGQVYEDSYSVKISLSDLPVLDYGISVPKAIIDGRPFRFASVSARDYSANGGVSAYEIYVTDPNGTHKLEKDTYKPAFGKEGAIRVVYRVFNADKSKYTDIPYDVQVIRPEYKDEYLLLDEGVRVTRSDNGVLLESAKDHSFGFVNPLCAHLFKVKFSVNSQMLDRVNIRLTDSVNAEQTVVLSVVKASSYCYLEVNGVRGGNTTGVFARESFELRIAENGVTIANKRGAAVGTLLTFENGRRFTGFASGKVYFEMQTQGILADAGVTLISLNDQLFDSYPYDEMRPQIVLSREPEKYGKFNEEYVIPYITAIDVLDWYTEMEVTVTGPHGKVYLDKADAGADNRIRLDAYGSYLITYRAFDSNGMPAKLVIPFRVADEESPVIRLDGKLQETAKVGQKIGLPKATASDNSGEELTVIVSVFDPTGKKVVTSDSFVPERSGVYVVSYFVKDAAYNYSRIEFRVSVS